MLPSGPSTPMGGAQQGPSSMLRSNSGILGGQGGSMSSQGGFPSLVPPRPHYNNVNMLGNVPNAQSLFNQSFGNGAVDPGLQGPNGQRGGMDRGAESDPLSGVGAGGGMGYSPSPSSFVSANMSNGVSSSQIQGQQFSDQAADQMLTDQQPSNSQSQQLEPQNFQHPQQPMQQQQFRSIRGGLGGIGQIKLESQVNNDQLALQQQQQLQPLRGLGHVKLEPQQMQTMRSQPHVKMEPQHSEQSMFTQQQLLQISRQSSSQAAAAAQINLLQQHRLLQYKQQQQQQQQQLLKAIPQQRPQMQQQFQAQNLPMRSPVKPMHEVGACAKRVNQYIYQQRNRPEENNIEFWRKFVAEFFAPNSKKKWCVSMYGSGRQTTGVFPQDVLHCEICKHKPGRGFEATYEVLPRLYKIKFESGTLEELLYVDMPREYHNSSGQIVLDYAKAIQESVYEHLRVVREGQLRIVFSPDLKICSWEFCARRHEELIPRRLLIPQVSQLGAAAHKYQAAAQNATSNASVSDLQGNCNMFLASAKQLAKALEAPSVNDLGYTKRYIRCLQISEVVNSMKDLIDYSRVTGTGPIDSLAKFPRRNAPQNQQASDDQEQQQQMQQQSMMQSSNGEQASTSQPSGMQQHLATANGLSSMNVNNPLNTGHQNSAASRPQNPINPTNSPYATTSIPSPLSTGTMQPPPQSQSSPQTFRSPTPPPNNNSQLNTANTPANMSNGNPSESQSSVQKIIQEMMLSNNNQLGGHGGMTVNSLGNDMKNVNSGLNGLTNGNAGFGFNGMGQAAMLNGIRAAAMVGNQNVMNGRVGMNQQQQQQQDLSNQLSGFGSANGFNNLQFDWKPSP